MDNKKAQAAMEFLMTYGWAILIVLVVLAALFALGVFNPSTPNKCLIGAPYNCQDIKVTAAVGEDAALVSVSGVQDGASVTFAGECTGTLASLITDQVNTVTLTCAGVTKGQRVKGTITGTYKLPASTLSHTISGTYSAAVE